MTLLENIVDIDKCITLFINGIHSSVSDQVMIIFSDVMIWIPLYVGLAIFLFLRLGWKRALIVLAAVGLTFAACDQGANIVKYAVSRFRPCHDQDMLNRGLRVLEGTGSKFGFFSAHASNTFGLAMCTLLCLKIDKTRKYKLYGGLIFFWATMVAISRIFVGKHFFGDVLVGAVVGTILGLIFAKIAKFAITKLIKA